MRQRALPLVIVEKQKNKFKANAFYCVSCLELRERNDCDSENIQIQPSEKLPTANADLKALPYQCGGKLMFLQLAAYMGSAQFVGANDIVLTAGEPLIHPFFLGLIREIAKRGMNLFEIVTTAHHINGRIAG